MMEKFFNPKSIAVIGATSNKEKLGYQIFEKVITAGYKGNVYPVNPKLAGKKLLGKDGFASVSDIPSEVDLAVIVIPSKFIPDTIEECGKKGIQAVVTISAGFKETGKKGLALERKLTENCHKYGIRMIGPNVLGIIDTHSKINASFAPVYPPKGNLAFFSQSGALGCAVLDRISGRNIGISKFISLGNKADVTEIDILKMLKKDKNSKVILGYLESIEDGRKFLQTAREVSRKKPVIMIKAGRTEWGSKAASSHTGALAGKDEAFDVAFKECGVIRVDTFEEAFSFVKGFLKQNIPTGNKVLVLTNAGGAGILATDMIEKTSLHMAEVKKELKTKLEQALPPNCSLNNPVDILGDARADRYKKALEIIGKEKNIDAFLTVLTPQSTTDTVDIAKVIAEEFKKIKKPVIASFMGYERVNEAIGILEDNKIPNYPSPEEAALVLEALKNYGELKKKKKGKIKHFTVKKEKVAGIIKEFKNKEHYIIGGAPALEIFELYGIPVVENFVVSREEELKKISRILSPPYVMKIESKDIVHKSDVGGVRLNLGKEQLLENFRDMVSQARKTTSNILGVSLQPMITDGKEMLTGVSKDEVFGHMVRFGLGGKYVEMFKDTSSRIVPLAEEDAMEMIKETMFAYPLLKGVRGEIPSDISAVVEVLLRLSQLVSDFADDILEIEANPFLVFKKGGKVIDARLTLNKNKLSSG